MLYQSPVASFGWQVSNFGATYSNTALGTNCPGHANANTKGANTALLAGIAEDCYGIAILLMGGATDATIRRQLTDILIDPDAGAGNAGASWSVSIANLLSSGPAFGTNRTGYWFYFPLYLKAGTAIGAAHQDLVATTQALRVAVRIFGKPRRPDALTCGTKVQTLGVDTSTTAGTTITPGTSGAWGSYTASLGTLNNDSWWWQLGCGTADTTMSAINMLFDVACNATNKIICAQEILYSANSDEHSGKQAFGSCLPIQYIGAGQNVYARANCTNSAADSGNTVAVYAMSN